MSSGARTGGHRDLFAKMRDLVCIRRRTTSSANREGIERIGNEGVAGDGIILSVDVWRTVEEIPPELQRASGSSAANGRSY